MTTPSRKILRQSINKGKMESAIAGTCKALGAMKISNSPATKGESMTQAPRTKPLESGQSMVDRAIALENKRSGK